MNAACKADKNPLFPTAKVARKPLVALAGHFGLLPERNYGATPFAQKHERFEEDLAHEVLNPLLYPDKVLTVLKQGFVRARSGQELRVEDAFAMFENYLGIAQRKDQVTNDVKNLSASQAERRKARQLQSKNLVMTRLIKGVAATQAARVRNVKQYLVEDYGFTPADIDKCSEIIEEIAFHGPLFLDTTIQMMIRRHTSLRKGRPDFNRFMADVVERATDHVERVRARTRLRVRRSRKQSRKPRGSSVQIGLGKGDSVKELNA